MKTVRQLLLEQEVRDKYQAYIKRIAEAGEHPHQWYSLTAEKWREQGLQAPGYIAHEVVCRHCGIHIDQQHNQQRFIQEATNRE